jgi:hypothetical protein
MNKLIYLLLILTIHATVLNRISDKAVPRLTPNDTILSTMGLFRLVLEPTKCSLRI